MAAAVSQMRRGTRPAQVSAYTDEPWGSVTDGNADGAGYPARTATDQWFREWAERQRDGCTFVHNEMWVSRQMFHGLYGQHFWRINQTTLEADPYDEDPPWRAHCPSPYSMSTVLQLAAYVAATTPIFYGEPATDDSKDRQAADAVTRAAQALYADEKLEERRLADVNTTIVDGTLVRKIVWSEGMMRPRILSVSAFDILVDGVAKTIEESRIVCHEHVADIGQLRHQWRDRPEAKRLRSTRPDPSDFPTMTRRRLGLARGPLARVDDRDLENLVLVREFYVDPTEGYPDGYRLVTVGRDVVTEGDTADLRALGYAKPMRELRYLEFNESYWGIGLPAIIRMIEPWLEQSANQIIENHAMNVWGMVTVDEDAVPNGGQLITTEAGQAIGYHGSVNRDPIRWQQGPAVPAAMLQFLGILVDWLQEVTGVRQPSRSQLPARIDSGYALRLAMEADRTRSTAFYKSYDAWENWGLSLATAMAQKWAPREWREAVIGRDRVVLQRAFDECQLGRNVDVRVKSAPSLSPNPALKQIEVRELLRDGLLTIEDAQEAMDLPTRPGEVTTLREMNANLAWANIQQLSRGEWVDVEPLWDHKAMLREFKRFSTMRDYLELPPDVKAAIREHVSLLQFMAVGAMQAEMMMNPAAMAGGAGMKPIDLEGFSVGGGGGGGAEGDAGASPAPAAGAGVGPGTRTAPPPNQVASGF